MKRILASALALILALLLSVPAFATDVEESSAETDELADLASYYDFEHRSLEEILQQFRLEFGLDENNFAMAYYATGTGDSYGFQADSYRNAGYTYMVPLNLIYYDKENAGELDPKDYVGTYWIPYLHEFTLTDSDEPMAKTMQDDIGEYREYREALTQYSNQEYTEEYYTGNSFNIRYVMNVLWHIYNHSGDYAEMIEFMKENGEDDYFSLYKTLYPVAHKYSAVGGVYNDIGIIYTPEPFLLAAFSQDIGHAENMLGRLAELMTEYTLYLSERKAQGLPAYTPLETEAPEEVQTEAEPMAEASADPTTPEEKEDGPVPVWVLILVIIVAAALVVLAYMKGMVKGAEMERRRIRAAQKKKLQAK